MSIASQLVDGVMVMMMMKFESRISCMANVAIGMKHLGRGGLNMKSAEHGGRKRKKEKYFVFNSPQLLHALLMIILSPHEHSSLQTLYLI